MSKTKATEKELHREVSDFGERFPTLKDDELFIVWFLRAFVADIRRGRRGTCASWALSLKLSG